MYYDYTYAIAVICDCTGSEKENKRMKNMKIGKRLVLSFIAVTIIASIAGIVGMVVSLNIDQQYSSALVVNGFAQGDIGRFNTYLNKGSALVRDVIFLNEKSEVEEAQKELEDIKQQTMAALAAVKENTYTAEEREQVAIIEKNLPLYQESREKVIALGLQMKNDEALQLFRAESQPYLNACMDAADALANMNSTMGEERSVELSAQSRTSSLVILVTIVVALGTSIVISVKTANSISEPLKEVEAAAGQIAQGNLKVTVVYQSGNELGSLADSIRTMIERISFYMGEISASTKLLAEGDLNVKESEEFLGDFLPVQLSIRNLVHSLNDTMGSINQSSDQVAAGSDQVSAGAQALSQGATEQASSVEELAATINEISDQVKDTAQNALDAREQTAQAGGAVTSCNQQMSDMIAAMEEITDKSNEISKIIKTIEDIAFQTNILALNAAVEAARAGEAGKGFAVVADEVRNLASKSAEASKNTSTLIAGSIGAVEKGTKIANGTADSLLQVVQGTNAVSSIVDKIAEAANEQASAIAQVTQGIDQISSVVQTNSATAEESAAASEELSGQAQMLKNMVARFKLRRDEGAMESHTRPETVRDAERTMSPARRMNSMDKY